MFIVILKRILTKMITQYTEDNLRGSLMATRSSPKRRIFFSIFVPPLVFAPVGVLLFLLDVEVSILRDAWYLSIFVCCLTIAIRDKTPLSQIGLSKRKLVSSLLLASAWEIVTYVF